MIFCGAPPHLTGVIGSVNSAVPPPPGLKPFDSLEPPKVGPADLGDGSAPVELMEQVGLL